MMTSTVRWLSAMSVFAFILGCKGHLPVPPISEQEGEPLSKSVKITKEWRLSPMTGEDLTQDCSTSSAPSLQNLCFSYLVGGLDMLDSFEASTNLPNLACVPPDVTGGQLAKVVAKYGNDHPQELHLQGAAFILKAFDDAWPCKDTLK